MAYAVSVGLHYVLKHLRASETLRSMWTSEILQISLTDCNFHWLLRIRVNSHSTFRTDSKSLLNDPSHKQRVPLVHWLYTWPVPYLACTVRALLPQLFNTNDKSSERFRWTDSTPFCWQPQLLNDSAPTVFKNKNYTKHKQTRRDDRERNNPSL